MQKTLLTTAVLASLASVAPLAHAEIQLVPTATGIIVNFTGLTMAGFEFSQIAGDIGGPVYGTLTSVSVNATLDASVDYTYADDLALYVDALPLSSGGLLQIGGYSNLGAAEQHSWANGGSSSPGTTVIDTVALTTPITFSGAASDPAIWLGNGYGAAGTEGTWSGSITLTGLSVTAVPEPGTWALFAAGGVGMMGWMARRRRKAEVAA